jgi:hypothetical protein
MVCPMGNEIDNHFVGLLEEDILQMTPAIARALNRIPADAGLAR